MNVGHRWAGAWRVRGPPVGRRPLRLGPPEPVASGPLLSANPPPTSPRPRGMRVSRGAKKQFVSRNSASDFGPFRISAEETLFGEPLTLVPPAEGLSLCGGPL